MTLDDARRGQTSAIWRTMLLATSRKTGRLSGAARIEDGTLAGPIGGNDGALGLAPATR
jgi:hypothetical protein